MLQPKFRSINTCSAFSAPSATHSIPSSLIMEIKCLSIILPFSLFSISLTSERSILAMLNWNLISISRFEYFVPKSSIASRKPIDISDCAILFITAISISPTDSVISICISPSGRSYLLIISLTLSSKYVYSSVVLEKFTEIGTTLLPAKHLCFWMAQTFSNTNKSTRYEQLFSSRILIKWIGPIRPCFSSLNLISASAPVVTPVLESTLGWKYTRNLPFSSSAETSFITLNLVVLLNDSSFDCFSISYISRTSSNCFEISGFCVQLKPVETDTSISLRLSRTVLTMPINDFLSTLRQNTTISSCSYLYISNPLNTFLSTSATILRRAFPAE